MSDKSQPNVFTIAPGTPFLKTLADALCDGTLVDGFRDTGDPLCLSDVTIYVPTRRAARALRSVFTERSSSKAAILPTIRALGEFDEDAGYFEEAGADALHLNPPINAQTRILELARLVREWAGYLPDHIRGLFGTDPLMLPSTPADAVWLARNLADLMDEVAREGGDWNGLQGLVPDDLAGWWQLTLEFTAIVSEQWPQYLAEQNLSDPISHRNAMIAQEIARLKRDGTRGPIIAAGSTGSVPATADLLQVIARLPKGAVVLPGLDQSLSDEAWDALLSPEPAKSFHTSTQELRVYGHPQYGLKKLLGLIGMDRREVRQLGELDADIALRNAIVSNALMPAQTTYQWSERKFTDSAAALSHVSEIKAPNEAQEAIAIAVALRQAIHNQAIPAALVTTDRTLARRVSAELERFGIKADDSGGTPLEQSPPAALFRLMLDVVFRPTDPVNLLALMKHPLVLLGMDKTTSRRSAEVLELISLRGGAAPLELPFILQRLQKPSHTKEQSRVPDYVRRITDKPREQAFDFAHALTEALQPLINLGASKDTITVAQAAALSVACFEALGVDDQNSLAHLYDGDAGEAFADILRNLVGTKAEFSFAPHEWPSIFSAMISGNTVKPRTGSDPRIHIWGALEARLQHVETIVLGGLNEKTWPARPSDDPLLSRGMKAGINLEPPERRIGLAAHDFQMLMGTKHVVLSRSLRVEGAPSVPSRWLQRMHALIGKDNAQACQDRAAHFLDWGRQLDLGLPRQNEPRPCPKPAHHLRPKSFSFTEIGRLRRDPYAIHAKRILGLEPLRPLLREPDAQERGLLFHAIAEQFIDQRSSVPGTQSELLSIGKKLFDEADLPQDTYALWWRRFEHMSQAFIAYEEQRAPDIQRSHVELSSSKVLIGKTGVTLSGRADRIDILAGGSAVVIDYKTGLVPSARQGLTLMEPQLALEAALLGKGGFFNGKFLSVSDLIYVGMKADGTIKPVSLMHAKANKELETGDQLAARAWEKLIDLIEFYSIETNGYNSRNAPFKEAYVGDYDHLARVAEWSGGGDENGGDEP